ncbi:MAG: tRNA lysidine(34) synthetase TilS [Myxococcales bacterium]|nr:tRNA lysidine(34) synthetase TilS [Myxococcales bacterium]USN50880.1 MAG: tRNA lysidine(34) synthetase TilS [Myxococcales bacterium]
MTAQQFQPKHLTRTRRVLQVLWSKFDLFLAPFMSQGVVIAVSGGPDSRALLEALACWVPRKKGSFVVATFDHGMRQESLLESQFICQRAKRLGFDVHRESFFSPIMLNEQELRIKRYQALKKICKNYDLKNVCTAHHLEDNAEGYMMALFGVGGGEMGAAMQEVQKFADLRLIRPFLGLKKEDLRLALNMLGLCDYARDSLDEMRIGRRAYIRHEIIPTLKNHKNQIVERLNHFAHKQAWQIQAVSNVAQQIIEWSDNEAIIQAKNADRAVLDKALCTVLKKLAPEKDLRQTWPTREKIINYYFSLESQDKSYTQGLDRPLYKVIVNHLKTKEYSMPGVVIRTNGTKVAIRRV